MVRPWNTKPLVSPDVGRYVTAPNSQSLVPSTPVGLATNPRLSLTRGLNAPMAMARGLISDCPSTFAAKPTNIPHKRNKEPLHTTEIDGDVGPQRRYTSLL